MATMSTNYESSEDNKHVKHKRRFCRIDGCSNIVKSQGLCQRHGAKPRMCKIESCGKQAQGNFDGMCKSHFKALKRTTTPLPPPPPEHVADHPPAPQGLSVYDDIIPSSMSWKPNSGTPMPLIAHLAEGFHDPTKSPAWHRNEERQARGLWPVHNPATQLECWERELVWTEILLLTGNPDSSFRHLARGWGRDKGFHMVLAQFICERRGNVERKKRKRESNTIEYEEEEASILQDGVGADFNDVTLYGDAAYNEALAADLFCFGSQSANNIPSSEDIVDGQEEEARELQDVDENGFISGDGSTDESAGQIVSEDQILHDDEDLIGLTEV